MKHVMHSQWAVACTPAAMQNSRMLNSRPICEDHSTSHKATHTTLMQAYYYVILMIMLTRIFRIGLMTLSMDPLGLMHSLKAIIYILFNFQYFSFKAVCRSAVCIVPSNAI
jgi:hypothetical protein